MPLKKVDEIFDGFIPMIRDKQGQVFIQAHDIQAAKAIISKQYWITTDGGDKWIKPVISKLMLVDVNKKVLADITRPQLKSFFEFVEQNTDNNYRDVKTNLLWRQVYY